MAGDWIKIEHVMPDKPEVISISGILQIEKDAVIGKLLRFWIWADQNCNADVTLVYAPCQSIDTHVCAKGFADALIKVGWLTITDGGFSIPNIDRHNGNTAKTRALTNNRVKRKRNADVTLDALPEKRREEKNLLSKESNKERSRFIEPTLEEVSAYCIARGNKISADEFIDFYEARGWKFKTGQPMKSWQAAVRTWEKNNFSANGKGNNSKQKEELTLEEKHERYRMRKLAEQSQQPQ